MRAPRAVSWVGYELAPIFEETTMKVKVFNRQGQLVGPVEVAACRQDRRAVARAAHAGAVPGRPRQGHRAAVLRHAARQQARRASTPASAAACRCFRRRQVQLRHRLAELLPAGGRARTSSTTRTAATAWSAPRSCAPAATPTSATCSTTDPRRPAALLRQLRVARLHRRGGTRHTRGSGSRIARIIKYSAALRCCCVR